MTSYHTESSTSMSVARRRTGTGLTILVGVLLMASGTVKMLAVPPVVGPLKQYGFVHTVPLVATLEIISGVLFLLPRTRSFGLVFASAFMGGAVATHIQHAETIQLVPAALVLALLWIATWLKHPAALWSF
ncbi:MAG TPA: DoxX family protein [Gemmatimonadaceae bacterium]|nr:DoxX family protein [Gemmatimonadaceae bacterium]